MTSTQCLLQSTLLHLAEESKP